ncbi:MAG TPA: Uma2 family endonuclease [Pyrinomonadaceae bacterium]|jgi:Uma2 family endonuclease|nr:Uma2 family endonuclease [Pyrinomonadaceae bacterium]
MSSIERLMTVADLDKYSDDEWNRYELIEGELFVSTAPGIPHQLVLQNLQVAIVNHLSRNPIGKIVPGAGAVFSNFDAVIPDLVIVRKERWDKIVANNRFIAAPDLVIEILSPGSENRKRDVDAKQRLYGKYGVEEYWIVDPQNRSLTIYRLRGNKLDEFARLEEKDEIVSELLPELNIKVGSLFIY